MKIQVHEFRIGDSDDPEIYAAEPLYAWQKTEKGRWVMEVAKEPPTYRFEIDPEWMGYRATITADIDEQFLTYYYLRWK